jgi:VWFA-related protein
MRRTLLIAAACSLLMAQQQDTPIFRSNSTLVTVTLLVKDKAGKPVADLKKEDLEIFENGKPQPITVFEPQSLSNEAAAPIVYKDPAAEPAPPPQEDKPTAPPGSIQFQDKRLLILYFDWSSMKPDDQVRALDAAKTFVTKQMTAADMLSIITYSSSLRTELDFTADRATILEKLARLLPGEIQDSLTTTVTDNTDEANQTIVDDTEFQMFNTDRKLNALQRAITGLATLPEKKSFIFFTGGVTGTGVENQAQLATTVNAAVRSNTSIYAIDARGLSAQPPGGDASTLAARGTGIFSGQIQAAQRERVVAEQSTLFSLAADTGGRALLDSNDLTTGMTNAQRDLQSYYILAYQSPDSTKDGRYRRIEVKLKPELSARNLRLDYRRGYYGEKDYKAFSALDKERQLDEALRAGDPFTDIPVGVEINWFRNGKGRAFVPVTVKLPGSVIPLAKKGGAETTQFDFIGSLRDARGASVALVRDEVKIKLPQEKAKQVMQRHLVYDTGFSVTPGAYRFKMLVRERSSGKVGTFEVKFTVPPMSPDGAHAALSSVVWSSQKENLTNAVGYADKKTATKKTRHPLVTNGEKLVPSVTRVFRADQKILVYAELYDAEIDAQDPASSAAATLAFYQGDTKVAETRPVYLDATHAERQDAYPVRFELPAGALCPGDYTAQLSVVESGKSRFDFQRSKIAIVPQ